MRFATTWKSGPKLLMLVGITLVAISVAVLVGRTRIRAVGGYSIRISPAELHLGLIPAGKVVFKKVTIANVGTNDLKIAAVKTSCGCTTTDFSASQLAPGAKEQFSVWFHSAGYAGPIEKAIIVDSDDQRLPHALIRIHAYVEIGVRLETKRVFLGAGRNGDVLHAVVKVYRDPGTSFDKIGARGANERISVRGGSWTAAEGGGEVNPVEITALPLSEPAGRYTKKIDLLVGNTALPLEVVYEVLPAIRAEPAFVQLSPSGEAVVHLKWSAAQPRFTKVDSIYGICEMVLGSSNSAHSTSRSYDLRIRAKPGKVPRGGTFDVVRVRYETSGNRDETVMIPVAFYYQPFDKALPAGTVNQSGKRP